MHELFELVRAPGQWDNDVDGDIGCVNSLVFHLHEWPKRPKQNKASEFVALVSSESQLIQGSLVLLCSGDTCQSKRESSKL